MTEVPPTGPIRDADAFDPEGLIPRAASATGERLVLVEAESRRPVAAFACHVVEVEVDVRVLAIPADAAR